MSHSLYGTYYIDKARQGYKAKINRDTRKEATQTRPQANKSTKYT